MFRHVPRPRASDVQSIRLVASTWPLHPVHAVALYKDPGSTLDDRREAVATLEDTKRIARRVLGGAHPSTAKIEFELQDARAALQATLEQEK